MDDQRFELLVQDLILSELSDQPCVSKVQRVVERPQRGKDIVIEASDDVRLFGNLIECRASRGLTIFVECKWTSSKALSFERIASNAAQNRGNDCDAFVVVTNSIFTAGAIWGLYDLFRYSDTRLVVIDGDRLGQLIKDPKLVDEIGIQTTDVDSGETINGVLVRDHMTARQMGSVEITISLQNQAPELRNGRLFLQSNAEWELKENETDLIVHLPPFGIQAFRLNATRQIPDKAVSLRIGLDLDGAVGSLVREYAGLSRLDFRPAFVGNKHEDAVTTLVQALENLRSERRAGLLVATIFAPAGTGKSRAIQELEARIKGIDFRWLKHEFSAPGAPTAIDALKYRAAVNGFPLGDIGEITDAKTLVRTFAETAGGTNNQIPVLVLEDTHNADGQTCSELIDLITRTPTRECSLALIVTGRNDHSHGNTDFQRLSDVVSDLPTGSDSVNVTLERFESHIARGFIAKIIRDAPPQVVDAIERLSGRVPAHIVQCVEWMLDMSVVRVVHRGAVGIIDHHRFISHFERLPPTMVGLLADRFDFLADEIEGKAAQEKLLDAALLGSYPPTTLFDRGSHDVESSVLDLLMDRRFLEPSDDSNCLKWHHENLLLHFRNWLFGEAHLSGKRRSHRLREESWTDWEIRGTELAKSSAQRLRAQPELLTKMDRLSLGRLASMAGQHEEAVEWWRDMLEYLRRVPGYSSVDIPTGYYEHLRFAYQSVLNLNREPDLLPAILKTMTYVGGYWLSLQAGSAAADYGIAKVSTIPIVESEKQRLRFWLRCLKAQFLMDAGLVRCCQGLLLQLQADLEASQVLSEDLRLRFEVYNSLGQLYGYLNHAELSLRCFDIADLQAQQLSDSRLEAKQLVDRSFLYQFNDFAMWMQLTEDAQRLNASSGTERHQRHADATLLSLQFILLLQEENELNRIESELDLIQRDCESSSYFSLMPRVYLLRAAIVYAKATENLAAGRHNEGLLAAADQLANHGLGIGVERGIGFASWQLRNLKALIALRRGNYILAREHLQAAFEIMRNDGLLFLGNADLSCPNQIVLANHIKILTSMGNDQDVKIALRDIKTYQKGNWDEDEDYDYAVKSALNNDALLGRFKVGDGLPRDQKTGLGLVVWL